ncbi:coiled-coil domain-containing protein 74A [Pygocentrus nattereri]|uniref:Uncharacterized protein n=1 Tax=Pygocentrus nattereri TaxID=42514 RepID=A0A3B4DJB4_PYGNA|nr:coiled-coil domain-containing protein 74A [Pygocentrus nattereri]
MDAVAVSLQRKIDFLQRQHRETLRELHSETERLRRQNQDLQFKLIMEPPESCRKRSSHKGQNHWPESNTFQKGIYFEQTVEDTHLPQDGNLGHQMKHGEDASETTTAGRPALVSEAKGGLITSLHPLRIHCNPSQPPRAPTLQECEVIIRQLYNANSLQSQDILRIKAVLKDIVFNKRITPENYILTKVYLADDQRTEEREMFPKLPFRGLSRGVDRPVCQANTVDRMILPALKQSLGISFAERQRRTRAMQRSRLRRTVT